MAPERKINVDVHISDTLRKMYDGAPRAPHPSAQTALPLSTSPPRDWHHLSLRRDGKPPIRFVGTLLFARSCMMQSLKGHAKQSLSIYLAIEGTVYAGLAFEPSEACPAWSSYRCARVHAPTDLAKLFRDWCPEANFFPAPLSAHCGTGPPAARSAFNAMAADWLTLSVLQG